MMSSSRELSLTSVSKRDETDRVPISKSLMKGVTILIEPPRAHCTKPINFRTISCPWTAMVEYEMLTWHYFRKMNKYSCAIIKSRELALYQNSVDISWC